MSHTLHTLQLNFILSSVDVFGWSLSQAERETSAAEAGRVAANERAESNEQRAVAAEQSLEEARSVIRTLEEKVRMTSMQDFAIV
jgi:hypothetical protein